MKRRRRFSSVAAGLVLILFGAGCSDDSTSTTPDAGSDQSTEGMVDNDFQVDVLPGSDSDGPVETCSLTISKINDLDVAGITSLTAQNDQDPETPGLQIDVLVLAQNLENGSEVKLSVTGLNPDPTETLASGQALFLDVTVTESSTVIKALGSNCQDDTITLDVVPPPECAFLAPTDGATLQSADDVVPDNDTFDYNVRVATKNAENGTVVLKVGASTLPDNLTPDSNGEVEFPAVVLPVGSNIPLSAQVTSGGVSRTCRVAVTVETDLPTCLFEGFSPEPVSTTLGVPGLGIAQDTAPGTAGLQTTIEIATNVDSVTLEIDGIPYGTVSASGGTATFSDVLLAEGQRSVEAVCASTASGASTRTTAATVMVDSEAPVAVDDLSCAVAEKLVQGVSLTRHREGLVDCEWTAAGDTAGGTGVETVEVRYRAGSPLSAANWNAADTVVLPDAAPFPAGTAHEPVQIADVPLGADYYFGIRTVDFLGNPSIIAVPSATPLTVDFKKGTRTLPSSTGWGGSMASGDFNCDGYTDLAVGHPDEDNAKGRVYIFLGALKTGLGANPVKILSGTVVGAQFGSALAALPNFDGDALGCSDLAVYAAQGGTNQGRVFVYLGRQPFPDRDDLSANAGVGVFGADLVLHLGSGAPATQVLGAALASAGDFDHDEVSDLALSFLDTADDSASVLVVHGKDSYAPMTNGGTPLFVEMPGAAGVQISGGKASESFGLSLANGTNLDNDDYDDLLIGAGDTQVGGVAKGAVHVVSGGVQGGTLPETIALSSGRVTTIVGDTDNQAFGAAVAVLGDVDQDAANDFNEFAVGDPQTLASAGAAYVFNLSGTPATAADALAMVNNDVTGAASDQLGIALGGAGAFAEGVEADFDGDGAPDLLVGAQSVGNTGLGAVRLLTGPSVMADVNVSSAAYTFGGPAGSLAYGTVVVLAQDFNGDGFPDLALGDPLANAGQGVLYLYY